MADLNGTPQTIAEGTWNIFVDLGASGTCVVMYSVEGLTAQSVEGGSYPKSLSRKSNNDNFRLPACDIHAVLTGTAVAKINTVGG